MLDEVPDTVAEGECEGNDHGVGGADVPCFVAVFGEV